MSKKTNRIFNSIGMIILLFIMFPFIGTQCIPAPRALSAATNDVEWKITVTGEIVDVDPIASGNTNIGLLFEFDGSFVWIWKENMDNKWPVRGSYGSFYSRYDKEKQANCYKWVDLKEIKRKKTAPVKQEAPTLTAMPIVSPWSSGLSPVNKIVVVKFNDDTTSTAYVNEYGEWKLDMSRKDYKGGRTLTNITTWKDIGL
jgi:hypothetical protein